ncbi:AAA family ATPase [Roseibium album]|uniref:AAA family ATPase n=1 Tax=Roseibium album TaxID=311410 RepID=UPI003918B3B9
MQLVNLSYEELLDSPRAWKLRSFELQKTNLVVGKNAVGKTRVLNVINGLARIILNGDAATAGTFDVQFSHDDEIWTYYLEIHQSTVIQEILSTKEKVFLDRKEGLLWSDSDGKNTKFKLLDKQVALNAKLDLIQTPFLEPFHQWAKSVYYFHFSSMLGKNTLSLPVQGDSEREIEVDFKDENQTTKIFEYAVKKYGEEFKKAILSDMHAIGYEVTDIGIDQVPTLRTSDPRITLLHGIFLKESDIEHYVDQYSMSTGMFRALAIIIHLNIGIFSKHTELILLDDIGEGLDFERSTALVKLLVSKIEQTNMQIVMTSNDRFIMNSVDVDYWTVLDRSGCDVRAINRFNNSKAFEDFKFSGLQNFNFFALDLAKETEETDD